MSHIFVSHATLDNDTVFRIHDELEAATGKNLWLDRRDIPPGADWDDAINTALRECDELLLILSRNAVSRPEVKAEWRFALFRGIPVQIAVIDDVPPLDIPVRLHLIQWVDLHQDWDAGIRALAAAIRGETIAPDAPVTLHRPVTGKIDRRLTTIPISGRDADLAEIKRLMKDNPTAILGVGGLGKSRLAAEIVLAGEDIGGAVWHVVSDISRADGVYELLREHYNQPPETPPAALLKKLRGGKRLIVLDNAEDVSEADPRRADYVALVDDLMAAGASVLLTSRAAWDDITLCSGYTPKTLSNEAARQIVLDMAKAFGVKTDLTPHADEVALAARLHPRLIEWGVRQMRHLPTLKVIADLQSLKSAEAQKALDEMILETLRQMTAQHGDGAASTLKQLNVCRGGFTYAAAESITAAVGTTHASSGATDDLDSHLRVLQTWQFLSFDGVRYTIDPLVIAAVGEDDSAHRPHYAYYKALARDHDKRQDYLGLDPDSDNLEAAFEWAMREEQYEDAYWLGGNISSSFLANRGRFEQRRNWLERVAASLETYDDDQLRAAVQNSLGILYQNHPLGSKHDNLRRAITAYTEALEHYTPLASPQSYAMTQNNLGTAYADLAAIEDRPGNLRRAITAYTEALVYRTLQAAPLDYAMTQNNLGTTYADLAALEDRNGNLRRAITAYTAALEHYTPQAAPLDYAMTQNNLGIAYRNLSELEDRESNLRRAVEAYTAALEHYTPQAAPLYYAVTKKNLGIAYEDLADLPAAIACWREAERYYRQMAAIDRADLMLRWIADAEARLRGDADS